MSAVEAVSTTEEAQMLLDTARRKAQELKSVLGSVIEQTSSGIYVPVPPRPNLEAIGLLATGVSQLLNGLESITVNVDR